MNKDFMKKTVIKSGIVAAVFVIALYVSSIVMNQGNTDMTTEMREASFPVLSMSIGKHRVNTLHGYSESMDTAYLRDTLLPVESDRRIVVQADTYGTAIESIMFEVRSLDGERLVESTEVLDYTQEKDKVSFEITLKDLIDADTEYMLIFFVKPVESEAVRYYTRIVQSDEVNIREKLDYITDFHERTFDKEEAAELTKYLESNAEGDNTTFHKVTIHSSFNQVTWGDLEVSRVTKPDITIRELGTQTGAFGMEYLVSIREGRKDVYYRVTEYYRIRYTPDRTYLLDFEREMEQIFDEEGGVFANDKVMLGIVGDSVNFMESDGGNVFAFAVADKLYSYNVTDNKLARLFSFYGNTEGLEDARSAYNRHDIQILTVDETGNVNFLVYGYMNRGRHEGKIGVAIYYYNSMTNTVEEQIYIPYDKSYSLLKADINKLSYVNRLGIYYFMLNGNVYAVNLTQESYQTVVSGLQEGGYQISESNKMIVWQDGDDLYSGGTLTLMNLSTQAQTTIRAGYGEYISILGFMDEDLIYGLAKKKDLAESYTGATVFPMYTVRIQSENGEVEKTYQKEGIYVTGSYIEDNQINLTRVVWNEELQSYEQTTEDQIMSTEQLKEGSNKLCQVVTEKYETITQIAVKNDIDSKSMKLLTPKEVLFEGNRAIDIPQQEMAERFYYVYGKNGIEGSYTNAGRAVDLAYRTSGVVVDDDGDYIWKRETRSVRNQIMAITEDEATERRSSMAVCLDTMLRYEGISRNTARLLDRGETVFSILESNLQDYEILDLSGCSLDAILYYVNLDIPVLAVLEDGNAVLVVGFNELNIVVMDPMTGTLYKKGMNDSTEWLEENGNRFISYIRKGE